MFYSFLLFISHISALLGIFFAIASFIGFIRYNDFYTKLHAVNMFNIYGMSFIMFAMAILTFDPIIFFEMVFVIILNSICSIAVVSALLRSAILNGVQYDAKTRDEVLKMREEEKKKIEEEEEMLGINKKQEDSGGYKNRTKEGSTIEEEDVIEEEKKKKKKKKKKKNDIDEVRNLPGTATGRDKALVESEDDKLRKEEEELKQKIKEQKRILRNKIAKARKDAFITRKKEEIERVEKEIHDLLAKHDLTEEDLKDDDEEEENSGQTSSGSTITGMH